MEYSLHPEGGYLWCLIQYEKGGIIEITAYRRPLGKISKILDLKSSEQPWVEICKGTTADMSGDWGDSKIIIHLPKIKQSAEVEAKP